MRVDERGGQQRLELLRMQMNDLVHHVKNLSRWAAPIFIPSMILPREILHAICSQDPPGLFDHLTESLSSFHDSFVAFQQCGII